MRELVRDHVMGKRRRAFTESRPEQHAAAHRADAAGTLHEKRPALSGHIRFLGDAKKRIVDEVALHFGRQRNENIVHAAA